MPSYSMTFYARLGKVLTYMHSPHRKVKSNKVGLNRVVDYIITLKNTIVPLL